MGRKKKYINIFGSFTEPINCIHYLRKSVVINAFLTNCHANVITYAALA